MKIMISNDGPTAHYYIRRGYARALSVEHSVILWDIKKISAYDAFDKFEPDIFWGQTYNLTEDIIKCIEERPHMYVILRAPDYSSYSSEIASKYPILTASQREIDLVNKLRDLTGKPNYLHCHYTDKSLQSTHENWIKNGYKVESIMNGADLVDFYGGISRPEYKSDITFIGGYWGYKSETLKPYLVNLCSKKYNIKLFGNQPWPVPQYCGFLDDQYAKDILVSATICPSISEPHSQIYGYDVIERPFKLVTNRCFVISDYVKDLTELYPDMIFAHTPKEFEELVNYYLDKPEERQKNIDLNFSVGKNYTYFDRAEHLLNKLGITNSLSQYKNKYYENTNNRQ